MSFSDESSLPTATAGLSNSETALPAASTSSSRPLQTDLTGNDDVFSGQDRQGALLNYYFVFLVLFFAIVCMLVYALHRRRKIRNARFRNGGQNALARDVDGWTPNGRRWVGGSWAARFDRHHRFGTRAHRRSADEGLDEYGEAPPPYKIQEANLEAGIVLPRPYPGPSVPLRTISRGEAGKLPGYDEATSERNSSPSQEPPLPATVNSATNPRIPT